MNILITGSTGFVGRHLVPQLIEAGHNVLELSRRPEFSQELYGDKTKKFDISNYDNESLHAEIKSFGPDILIHLASYLTSADDYQNSKKLINSNIFFLNEILSSLRETGLKLFINTGTFAEYFKGDGVLEPAYLYAATKTASRHIIEYYATAFDFNYINVIPYTIYGGNDTQKKIIDYIYDSLNSENAVDLSPGEQILDFIHVDDVVAFYLSLVNNYQKLQNKTVFHLGTGIGHNLKQVAQLIEETTASKVKINWGGKPYRKTDVMYAVADISAQNSLFKWTPRITLKEGVEMHISKKN
jgi:nucleoside-diphosphate-sugar epimerase